MRSVAWCLQKGLMDDWGLYLPTPRVLSHDPLGRLEAIRQGGADDLKKHQDAVYFKS